jgi:hypothetical protein
MNKVINGLAFAVLTVLWIGFGAALLFNQAALDSVWQLFTGMPWIVQGIVGLLVLPVALGLWIWESSWPIWLRLVPVAALAVGTVYVFFPRRPQS